MPRGGKRPGAGRPKGSKEKQTLEKEALRLIVRERVAAELMPMLDSQIKHAKGLSYLVWRDKKTGKFKPVPSAEMAETLSEQGEVLEIWPEKPNVQAFTDLLDRALDKAAQPVKADVTGDVLYRVSWRKHE